MHARVTEAVSAGARRFTAAVPVLACSLALAAAANAQGSAPAQPGAARAPVAERNELQWLQAIQQAAQRLSFVGTIVYQQGGAVRTSRIVHLFDGNSSHERLQLLDGKPREFIRRDAEVQCLYPDSRRVLIERRPDPDFPSLGAGAPAEILERYAVKLGAVERVAGYDCRVILLEPRDALRYGYRLCADLASGLLLRAQTLNERQDVLEQMAFADLRVGERVDRSMLRPSWSTDGWKFERREMQPADVARSGWLVPAPAGFRKLREVGRVMPGHADTPRRALQVVFSDGLATLSVFIEADAPAAAAPGAEVERAHAQGATSGYKRRISDALVTVVGEVPPATAKAVAESVAPAAVPEQKNAPR